MSKKNRTTPLGKPQSRKTKIKRGNCFNCGNCMYHSEGDSYCDENFEFVLEDWCPTDEFMWCNRRKLDSTIKGGDYYVQERRCEKSVFPREIQKE